MNNERYIELERSNSLPLTEEEIKKGWHWCGDWDYMLVGPGMAAVESCTCVNDFKQKEQS